MMNLAALAASAAAAPTGGFRGQWHAIELQPEPAVPQHFIVGVAISSDGALLRWRLADHAERMLRFYGQAFSEANWRWAHGQMQQALLAAQGQPMSDVAIASPQIRLGAGNFTSAADADSALNRAFSRAVSVTAGEARAPRTVGIPQDKARHLVNDVLRLRLGLHFGQVAQPEVGLIVQDGGTQHRFDITHDDGNIAASVVSAAYASLDTARLNLLRATSDLYRWQDMRKRERIGIALISPAALYKQRPMLQSEWIDFWNEETYKFRQSDRVLVAEQASPQALAEDLVDWFAPAA